MKKIYSLLSIVLAVVAVLFTTTASATPVPVPASTPINSDVIYLVIAAAVIAIVVFWKFKGVAKAK